MDKQFIQELFDKQSGVEPVPSNERIAGWARNLTGILFPEKSENQVSGPAEIEEHLVELKRELSAILNATKACNHCNNLAVAESFFKQLPELHRLLQTDVKAILSGDPAAHNEFEIIRAYPGFFAICFYRIAHALHQLKVPIIPRILTEYAHTQTGIDIHPAAIIGEYFFIDHGTGIVVGETTEIGRHVKLYQGVTLGALSVEKSMANLKRHPTVEDDVVIYSNATILGGETVIGQNSIIGGNVWLTKSVPPYSTVYHKPEITVVTQPDYLLQEKPLK
jgi:serine O-acetyltransferase